MIATTTTWEFVGLGSYVKAHGKTWKVTGERRVDPPRIAVPATARDGEKRWLVGEHGEEVEILIPTGPEAVSAVRDILGGEVVVIKMEHLDTRDTPKNKERLAEHLYHEHGFHAGTPSSVKATPMEELVQLHAGLHSSPPPGHGIPHVHVPFEEIA